MKYPQALRLGGRGVNRHSGSRDKTIGAGPRPDMSEPQGRIRAFQEVIEYAQVETSYRWSPTPRRTFGNVYVHDIAHMLGAYVPLAWWTYSKYEHPQASKKIHVERFTTIYGPNQMIKWLQTHGHLHGWVAVPSMEDLSREMAERSTFGIHWGQHVSPRVSGHLSLTFPELPVTVEGSGVLQSMAGAENRQWYRSNGVPMGGAYAATGYLYYAGHGDEDHQAGVRHEGN